MKRVLFLMIAASTLISAQLPTGAEAKKVVNFFQTGSQALLVEHQFCLDIGKEGDLKNNCAAPVADANAISEAQKKVFLWMNYLVPKDLKTTILIQFKKGGKVLKTKEIKVSTSYRYRTWVNIPMRAGQWEVSLEQVKGEEYVPLKTIKYAIVE